MKSQKSKIKFSERYTFCVTRFKTRGFTPSLENGLAPSGVLIKKQLTPITKLSNFFLNSPRREATKPFFSAGFTIIEIVTIIAIISLLSSIIAFNASKSRSLARDGQRVADLTVIQNALNLYFADNKKYPPTITSSLATYLSKIPADPKDSSAYKYVGIDISSPASPVSCESYHLGAVMENTSNSSLKQDRDVLNGSICTGSAVDFHGNATNCSGTVSVTSDPCFDLAP